MGQTRTVLGDEMEMAFGFHDEGYIELAPCTPFVRSVIVSHTAGSNIISSQQEFLPHMEGQYIYIGGWLKIRQVTDSSTAIISQNAETSGATVTPVVTMNELAFEGDTELTKLEIDYTPRVR